MNIQELRIGNKVIANGLYEGQVKTVNGIEDSKKDEKRVIWFREGEPGEYIEDIQPIPLTEEWLLKFGFEKREQMQFGGLKYVYRKYWEGEKVHYFEINEVFDLLYANGRKNIRYVHELQNCFYILTGKELTL